MDLTNTSEVGLFTWDYSPVEIHSEALIQAFEIVRLQPQHVQFHSTTVNSTVTSENVFLNHSTSNSKNLNEVLAKFGPEFPRVELGAAFDYDQAPSDCDVGLPKTNLNRVMHSNVSEFVEENYEVISPTRNDYGLGKQENSTITGDEAVVIKGQLDTVTEFHRLNVPTLIDERQRMQLTSKSKLVLLEIGERPFKCEECNATFSEKHNLKRHQLIHSGEKPYECEDCNSAFRDRSSLTRHQRIHSGERPYKCKECNSTFSDRSSLTRHQRIHSGERPYKCKKCNSTFSDRSSLTRHQRIHSGERPYKCKECNSTFSDASNLKSHERVHSGETPFKCKDCNSSYSDPSNLRSHQRIHSNERPFMCDICKESFRRKDHLKAHMIIHSRKKSHKCNECKREFTHGSYLKWHLRTHSKKKAAQP